ncbi:hypothetical protein P692DRAFT_2078684 [Suillus brevipes Sb2]|nr:hypothetical protein P692DRAFT_2078684 [Suillus brevipes Sb2]
MRTEFPSFDVLPHTPGCIPPYSPPFIDASISSRCIYCFKHAQGCTARVCGHARDLESQSVGNAFTTSWGPTETLDGVAAGKEFSIWIDNLLEVTVAEYVLLAELAPLSTNTLLQRPMIQFSLHSSPFSRLPCHL